MLNRKINGALMGIAFIALLSACGQPKTAAPGPAGQTPAPAQGSAPPAVQTPAPPSSVQENKQIKVKVYYGDETGENLVERETDVSVKQDSDKYLAALNALTRSPDGKSVALMQGFTVKSAVLKEQTLVVDVSMPPESRLGAGGEDLLLQALKKTLFQFSEIQNFDLLVDGQAVDSLMGHMELPHPIKRS